MTELKRTPGPWKASPSDPAEGYHVWWIVGNVEAHNGERDVCSVAGGSTVSEGDARLIAAAPDLLASCQRLLEELRLIRMKDCGAVYDVTCRMEAEATIAKALGE